MLYAPATCCPYRHATMLMRMPAAPSEQRVPGVFASSTTHECFVPTTLTIPGSSRYYPRLRPDCRQHTGAPRQMPLFEAQAMFHPSGRQPSAPSRLCCVAPAAPRRQIRLSRESPSELPRSRHDAFEPRKRRRASTPETPADVVAFFVVKPRAACRRLISEVTPMLKISDSFFAMSANADV